MSPWNELLTDLAWHDILHRHFRPSQNRKRLTAKWLTNGKQLQEVAVWLTLETPPSSRPILICFGFRSKPSLITVICMDPHSPNKLFATKYCFLILGDEFRFLNHFFIFRVFFFLVILCYFAIINFNKKQCYYYHFIDLIFFSWKLLLFFHVRGCSGMFRNVPECSVFWLYGSKRGRLIDIRRLKGRGAYC